MSTPEDIQLRHAKVNFFQLAKQEPNPRVRMRFLALGHLKQGKSKKEIITMFKIVHVTLRNWVMRFVSHGVEGLKEQPGKGRKKKLSAFHKMNTQDSQLRSAKENFFQLANQEPNPRVRVRFLALGHLKKGKSKEEVIEMLQISSFTLRRWIVRFINRGVPGLKEQPGRGRKKKLSTEQEEEFRKEIEKLKTLREGRRIFGHEIQVLLKEKFHVDYSLPNVYLLLERCGFVRFSARSKSAQKNSKIG